MDSDTWGVINSSLMYLPYKHCKEFLRYGRKSIECDRLRINIDTYKKNVMRKEEWFPSFSTSIKFFTTRFFCGPHNVDITSMVENCHMEKRIIGKETQRRVEYFYEQTAKWIQV